jgi:transposase
VLYLPPYSPGMNPIENAFSKLKQLMRSAQHRTREALWSDMQRLLDQITPDDARGFFRHCCYKLQEK